MCRIDYCSEGKTKRRRETDEDENEKENTGENREVPL